MHNIHLCNGNEKDSVQENSLNKWIWFEYWKRLHYQIFICEWQNYYLITTDHDLKLKFENKLNFDNESYFNEKHQSSYN